MLSMRLRLMLPAAALGLGLVMLAGPGDAATRPRPIHPERQKMSPDARRDAVLADLEDVLTGPAGPAEIATRPYASYEGGLCRRDMVVLSYAVAPGDNAWRAPLKPTGVSRVYTQYHFLGERNERNPAAWAKECAALSGSKAEWVTGKDDHDARDAFVIRDVAIAAVKAGDPGVTFDCKDPYAEPGSAMDQGPDSSIPAEPCGTGFVAAIAGITGLGTCPDKSDCFGYGSSDYLFTITLDFTTGKRKIRITMLQNQDIIIT